MHAVLKFPGTSFRALIGAALLSVFAGVQVALAEVSEHAAEAAEGAMEGAAHAAEGAEHHSGGLPQLDPTTWPSQIFWLAVTMLVLYIVLSRRVLPELSSTIENRRGHIQGDIDMAEEHREKAEQVHQAYEEILEEARLKASAFYAKVEDDIRSQALQKANELRERAARETHEMEVRLESAKRGAMEDMGTIAAEIASKAAEKIVGIPADIDEAKNVVKNLRKKAA